jgi:hypothetical protein
MALLVNATGANQARITAELVKICPNVRVDPASGVVSLVRPLPPGPGCCCVDGLVNPPNPNRLVLIIPLNGPATPIPGFQRTIGQAAGGATVSRGPGGALVAGPGGVLVPGTGGDSDVYLDITDNQGAGYFVRDATGAPIDDPLDVILYHELCTGHATEGINGMLNPAAREAGAIPCENQYRAAQVPPRTARGRGFASGSNPPGGPRPPR